MSIILTDSPSRVVARLLISQSVATSPANNGHWPVYVSKQPDKPDNLIVVVDTAGLATGRLQIDGEVQEHYGIQIAVRGTDFDTARARVNSIIQKMDQVVKQTSVAIGSKTYLVHNASRSSGMLYLGQARDNSERELFTVNYLVTITEES